MAAGQHSAWVEQLLAGLEHSGPEASAALTYIHEHRIRVGVHAQPTGARWTVRRHIDVSPHFVEGAPDDALALSLVIHEVRHLQQGPLVALSVYGEMEAWQLQFRFVKTVTGRYAADPRSAQLLDEIVQQPLGWDRAVLQKVRGLMREYAGPRYRIDLLPLYPMPYEMAYRLTGRQPRT